MALTTRALGTGTHRACVLRMAPVVQPSAAGETPGTVTVYCRLLAPPEELRSGMSGLARINCGRESIAVVLTHRVRRHLRTEFWW